MKKNKELNQLGLFPGPDETEELFLKRVSHALSSDYNNYFPSIEKYYGFSPSWISVDYTNKGLLPWEGGCTWIFEEDSVLKTSLQLRRIFKTKDFYLKIYNKEEIITHELAHVGRIAFEEPEFEEFLAYRTSSNSFRKHISPVIERAYEAPLFLSSIFIVNLCLPLVFNMIPFTLLLGALLRLKKRHNAFQQAINSLKPLLGDNTEGFLYRLKDEEIIFCASHPIDAIIERFSANTFRYAFLRECYKLNSI